jgi:hypothetical protein
MLPIPACDLAPLHTLGLRAQANHLVHFSDAQQLEALLREAERPLHVLGGGSNLVPSEQVDGTVLKVELLGRTLLGEDADAYYVAAAAGENWHDFVQWTLAQGWPGLENLSLIPGTVGAAPIQNIGAYGLELKDRFHGLAALSLEDGATCIFTAEHCEFGGEDAGRALADYRGLVPPAQGLAAAARLRRSARAPGRPGNHCPGGGRRGDGHPAQQAARPGRDRQCRQLLSQPPGHN